MTVRLFMAGTDYSGTPWVWAALPGDAMQCEGVRRLVADLAGHDDIFAVDVEVPDAVTIQTRPLPETPDAA